MRGCSTESGAMMNKYNARKATAPDGQRFDSVKEMNRYCELKLLERSGKIRDLRRQVKFELVPVQRGESPGVYKAGPQKGMPKPGSVTEQAVNYVADFCYRKGNEYIVEDVKGCRKGAAYDLFVIKRKLMLYVHGIRIKEV